MITLEKIAWAENTGRAMARADMAKEAHTQELVKAATEAGEVFAKCAALGGLGATALAFAKKNPGAVIGGGLGALHGLAKNDGGVVDAITDGATGAALGRGAQHLHGMAMKSPTLGPKLRDLQANVLQRSPTPISDDVAKMAHIKEAFGAALMSGLKAAVPAAMNFIKSNPLKAGIGAAGALSNFSAARKSGEGLGSSLLSGAAGAASAL